MPTVEGNSTFYSVPGPDTFRKWADVSADGFQFCFKFPRTISHDRKLEGSEGLLGEWIARLQILADADRLGPTFLQLAPSFSSRHFAQLAQFLDRLPNQWSWAVEVRHRDWFDEDVWETKLNRLLSELGMDRVIFDSRPLNSMEPSDDAEAASQVRKPKVPLRREVTGSRPMVRLIGRNEVHEVESYWEDWADTISTWITQGLQPWIFTHAPDDAFAPSLVYALHEQVRRRLPHLPELPRLDQVIRQQATMSAPDKSAPGKSAPDKPIQLRLFDDLDI